MAGIKQGLPPHHISHNDAVVTGEGRVPRTNGGVEPRNGTPKRVHVVPVHPGMHSTTAHDHTLRVGGGDMSSALSSGSVGPGIGDMLQAPPKRFADAKPVFGQRSRNGDVAGAAPGVNHAIGQAQGGRLNHGLGRAILAAAIEGKRRP